MVQNQSVKFIFNLKSIELFFGFIVINYVACYSHSDLKDYREQHQSEKE